MRNKRRLVIRLLIKSIRQGDCHIWNGYCNKSGYGVKFLGKKPKRKLIKIHRLAFELFNGRIPRGLCVLHECDNPPCWKPDHLFLGTRKDNLRDMTEKGRRATGTAVSNKGIKNGNSKLTEIEVKSIKKMWLSKKYNKSELARKFGVTHTHIRFILSGKLWNHIKV